MPFIQKYYKEILLGLIIALILGLYALIIYLGFFKSFISETVVSPSVEDVSLINESDSNQEKEDLSPMYAEIKGQVNKPGVYAITKNTIINDIVNLAGGFKKGAYTNNINLSKKAQNEMVIMVYSTYEYNKLNKPQIVYIEKECNCPSYDLSACINSGNSVITPGEGDAPNKEEKPNQDEPANSEDKPIKLVNINSATEAELMTLSGIGESKAKAIIAYRKENGNFQNISDITKVSGISDKIYEKLKDYITV